MEFETSKTQLLRALKATDRVADLKSSGMVSCVKMEAEGSRFRVWAYAKGGVTDGHPRELGDYMLGCGGGADVHDPGSCVVDARKLRDAVKTMPTREIVTVSLDTGRVRLNSGRVTVELDLYTHQQWFSERDDYKLASTWDAQQDLDARILKRVLRHVLECAGDDPARASMTCVRMEDNLHHNMTLTATDGHRLAHMSLKSEWPTSAPAVNVPAVSLGHFHRALKDLRIRDGKAVARWNEDHVHLKLLAPDDDGMSATLLVQCWKHKFSNWQTLINVDKHVVWLSTVEVEAMKAVLGRAKQHANVNKQVTMHFTPAGPYDSDTHGDRPSDEDLVEVEARDGSEGVTYRESMVVTECNGPARFGLNADYMIAALGACVAEEVTWKAVSQYELTDEEKGRTLVHEGPIRVCDDKDLETILLVMPARV